MNIIYQDRFVDGFAQVQRKDGRWNLIDTKGHLISPNMWFMDVFDFTNKFARVRRIEDGLWNFIDEKGHILSPNMWFRNTYEFTDKIARIQRQEDGLWNAIDKKGNILSSNLWFNEIYYDYNRLSFIFMRDGIKYFMDDNYKFHNLLIK